MEWDLHSTRQRILVWELLTWRISVDQNQWWTWCMLQWLADIVSHRNIIFVQQVLAKSSFRDVWVSGCSRVTIGSKCSHRFDGDSYGGGDYFPQFSPLRPLPCAASMDQMLDDQHTQNTTVACRAEHKASRLDVHRSAHITKRSLSFTFWRPHSTASHALPIVGWQHLIPFLHLPE